MKKSYLTVSEINICMDEIDSDKSLMEEFSDGVILYDGFNVDFSNYKLYDNETQELNMLTHTEYSDTTLSFTFYYKEGSVIFAKAEKILRNSDKYSHEQKVYYSSGNVIFQTNENRFNFDLHELGLRHLKSHREEFEQIKKNGIQNPNLFSK